MVFSKVINGDISWYPFSKICLSSIKFDNALSNKASLSLTKTNLEPLVLVAKSKLHLSFSPNS